MSSEKIGIQLASLGLPFKKALHMAARLGAAAVEIDARGEIRPAELSQTGLRSIRKMLADNNLRVCAVSFRTRRGYDVADGLERRISATKQAMTMAYRLGAPVVVNQVGRIPSQSSEPAWQRLLEALTDIGRFGQHEGALLAAETGTESGPDMAQLLSAVPLGTVAVNFDPANLIVNDFSPHEALAAIGPYIRHVHAKDAVRDLAQGRGVQVPLGRGSADLPALLGALEEYDYHGYFTIEREGSDDPVVEIAHAMRYLREVLPSGI